MPTINFKIEHVSWQRMEKHLRQIRMAVFIQEQNVPIELEWDKEDEHCLHLLVIYENDYIATARLLDSGQIGRMAVLKAYRHKGVGSAMLEHLVEVAREKTMSSVYLNAQITAVDFYKKFGFVEQGELFNDAGIMHRRMRKELTI